MTQQEVDDIFVTLKEEWDRQVTDSGYTDAAFIMMDKTGFAKEFLYYYQLAKDHVESLGLVMPVLVEGLTCTINGEE